jgi:hypothetical protein
MPKLVFGSFARQNSAGSEAKGARASDLRVGGGEPGWRNLGRRAGARAAGAFDTAASEKEAEDARGRVSKKRLPPQMYLLGATASYAPHRCSLGKTRLAQEAFLPALKSADVPLCP